MIEVTYPCKEQSHQPPQELRTFTVPGMLSAFKSIHSFISSLNQFDELGIITVLIIQVRKIKYRKVK